MREYRLARAKAREIVDQRFGRGVAALRLVGESARQDKAQVAGQRAVDSDRRVRGMACGCRIFSRSPLRPMAGQNLVQQQSEGEDVGRSRDRAAGELLGRCVLRRQ